MDKKEKIRVEKNKIYYELRKKLKEAYIINDYASDMLFSKAILKRIKGNKLKCKIVRENIAPYICIDEEMAKQIFDEMTKDVFKVYNNGSKSFEHSEITEEVIRREFYTYEECKSKLKEYDVDMPCCAYEFKYLELTIIAFRSPFTGLYFYKNDFDKIINILNVLNDDCYVRVVDIEELNFLQSKGVSRSILKKTYQVDSIRNPPFKKQGVYIKKEDIEKILNRRNLKSSLNKSNTAYEKLMILIENSGLKIKKPKTEKMFLSYCLNRSNTLKDNYSNLHIKIYRHLCNETLLYKELEDMTEREQKDFAEDFIKIIQERELTSVVKEVVYFFKYLHENYSFNGTVKYVFKKKSGTTDKEIPYEEEDFIKLHKEVLKVLYSDEDITKLIGNYTLSSILLYIYLHYCIIWRRSDMIYNLPRPNMRLIEKYLNGKDIVTWLKDGNKFTEEMGSIICKDIEEQIKRLDLEAGKNKELLSCYISEHTYESLGLLFCICESNRVEEDKETLITKHTSEAENVKKNLKRHFNIDIDSILKGNFLNRRANKSYSRIIENTAEAFGWFGYEIVQKLRSHKSSETKLSEVTKVYLIKDVTEASKEAFENGTMGSIKYQVLSLVDDKFKTNTRQEKIKKANDFNLTPLQIETALKILNKNSVDIGQYLTSNINNKEEAKKLLKEIIYGKNYCKHLNTKCLKKSMDSAKGTIYTAGVTVSNDCKLNSLSGIGCPFMIAKHYFLYEFKDRFDMLLDSIENSKSEIDKSIHINRLIQLYVPFILELQNEFGTDIVNKNLDVKRYNKISNQINKIEGAE